MNPIMVVPLVIGAGLSIRILIWLYKKLPKDIQEGIPRAIIRVIGVTVGFRLLEISRDFFRSEEPIGLSLTILVLGIYTLYSLLSAPFQYEQKKKERQEALERIKALYEEPTD